MGTEKRERQKANRLQRQMEEAKAERVDVVKRNVLRWGLGIFAAIAGVVLIAWIGGAFSSDDTVATSDQTLPAAAETIPADTIPADTTPIPPKPQVSIPDEQPTELVVTDLVEGAGPAAQAGDTVLVRYVGVRSEDGVEFDSNYDGGAAFPVVLGSGGVIQGWEDGLIGVKAGGRRQLDIPSDLAYGDSDRGTIRAGDALSFVIDVVSVTPGASS